MLRSRALRLMNTLIKVYYNSDSGRRHNCECYVFMGAGLTRVNRV